MKKYDSIMIGFGKGAKTLAAKLASRGEKVAVAEKSDKMYGGTCINVGCIPSKFMTISADSARFFSDKKTYYGRIMQEKKKLVSELNIKNFNKLNSFDNIDVLTAEAEFIGEKTLRLSSGEEITADKIFINTGSMPFVPNIDGASDNKHVYTSESILDLAELPERLLIVGGGYIGLEFASYFSGFGVKVTVFNDKSAFMPRDDKDIAKAIFDVLSQKIDFAFNAKVMSIEEKTVEKSVLTANVSGEIKEYEAEAILLATGRIPNTASLNAGKANIKLSETGAVITDEYLQTSAPGVYVMGDAKGGLQFTYISLDDYRIIMSNLYGGTRTTLNRGAIPYSVFVEPCYSHVGLNEEEAVKAGYSVAVGKLPAAAIPKAKVLGKTDGLLKAVVDRKTHLILGASLFCAESYEMINIVKLAIDAKLPFETLRDAIYTHPTMSEAFNDLFAVEL